MKIIFLDIDGVLNAIDDWIEWELLGHDKNHSIRMLNRTKLASLLYIVQASEAKVVISSTWRLLYSLDEIRNMFAERGAEKLCEHVIDITPTDERRFRGKEIKAWLDAHPQVERYIIIDDSTDMLEEQKPFFVRTQTYVGLTYPQTKEAIKLLTDKDDEHLEAFL